MMDRTAKRPWGNVTPPPSSQQQPYQAGPQPHVPGTFYGAASWLFCK